MSIDVIPELFGDGECGKPLPSGELLQKIRIGQYCTVRVVDADSSAEVVLGTQNQLQKALLTDAGRATKHKRNVQTLRYSSSAAGSLPPAGSPGIYEFGALLDSLEDPENAAPIVPEQRLTVAVDGNKIASLLASRTLNIGEQQYKIDVNPSVTGALLEGRATRVSATLDGSGFAKMIDLEPSESLVSIYAEKPMDEILANGEYNIPEGDFSRWLVDPTIPGVDGKPFKLALTPDQILGLASEKITQLVIAGNTIDLMIRLREEAERRNPTIVKDAGAGNLITTIAPLQPAQVQPISPPLTAADFDKLTLAVYFEWEQAWTLKGFSRGRMLQSIPLAPQEETTIELFTWDRRRKTLEQSSLTETEQSLEDEQKTQDSSEVYHELTKRDEFQWKVGGDLDVQYNGSPVIVKLHAQAGADDKTNTEDITKQTTKNLSEGLQKATAKVRTQRTSKISETTEFGREERVTRKIRNPNMCHTLNLDFYELITHYEIKTSFNEAAMRFCVMLKNPYADQQFTDTFVRQNETPLRDALLERTLAGGFEGLRFLRARQVALIDLERQLGERQRKVVATPKQEDNSIKVKGVAPEERAADDYLKRLAAASWNILEDPSRETGIKNVLANLIGQQPGVSPGTPNATELDAAKRWLADQLFRRTFSQLALTLEALGKAKDSNPSIRDWGNRLSSIMPSATALPRPFQPNSEPDDVIFIYLAKAVMTHTSSPTTAGTWFLECKRVGLFSPEDAGLGKLIQDFDKVYRAFLKSEEAGITPVVIGGALAVNANQQQDEWNVADRLQTDFPLRDYAYAVERSEALLVHLQANHNHYAFALFRAQPPQAQLTYIEDTLVALEGYFSPGFFTPRVVSQIGKFMLVPLNDTFIPKAQDLLKILKARTNIVDEVEDVLLPSPGMTIEARLGNCDTCEDFIDETRQLDLALRREQVRQAKLEADRMDARLKAEILDEPSTRVPSIQVELKQPDKPVTPS